MEGPASSAFPSSGRPCRRCRRSSSRVHCPSSRPTAAAASRAELHYDADRTVFSAATGRARYLIEGEARARDETRRASLPFRRPPGQLLDRLIVAMGLDPAKRPSTSAKVIKCRRGTTGPPERDRAGRELHPYLTKDAQGRAQGDRRSANTAVASSSHEARLTKVLRLWKLTRQDPGSLRRTTP